MNRLKTDVAEFTRAAIASRTPIAPKMWLPTANALSRCPGWMASMLLIATFGSTMPVIMLIGQWLNGPIISVMGLTTWFTWSVVSCLAMSIGCVQSVGNIRRLGLASVARFRIWFELGRLTWHLAFIGFVTTATVSFIASELNAKPIESIVWSAGLQTVESLLIAFGVTGSIGYAVALGRWRIPNCRAFECVNFFLPLATGGYLFFYAIDRWPCAAIWPDGVLTAMVGCLGILIFGTCFTVNVYQMKKWETRAEANHRINNTMS